MIILTNCLTELDDEGSLKVAKNLVRNLRKLCIDTKLVTYENKATDSDIHFELNKIMINAKLAKYLVKNKEPVLYMPLYTRMLPMAVRVFVLSLYAHGHLNVLIYMLPASHTFAKFLLKISGANMIVLSNKSANELERMIGRQVHYLRAGVDCSRYRPVKNDDKQFLKMKYGLPLEKLIVLHVGHMKYSRNIDKLLLIDNMFHIVFVTSVSTAEYKDVDLEEKLKQRSNLTVIDTYVEHIEELYQLSDVYFFPVVSDRNCIDSPLSVFEAAACDVPVVTTAYRELEQMRGKNGFYFIDKLDSYHINKELNKAVKEASGPRKHIQEYDWMTSASVLMDYVCGGGGKK